MKQPDTTSSIDPAKQEGGLTTVKQDELVDLKEGEWK